ncbi:MAG: Amuc_1098 family type IV pilus outer membrane protein [Verrucomicrobiota bacterium]
MTDQNRKPEVDRARSTFVFSRWGGLCGRGTLLLAGGFAAVMGLLEAGEISERGVGGGTVESVAEREVARRQAELKEAQALIQEGDLLYTQGQLSEAVASYREAFLGLRDTPAMAVMRAAALAKYERTATAYARQLVDEARFQQAEAVLDGLLLPEVGSRYAPAERLRERLRGDDFYNKANSPEHLELVRKVEDLLRKAHGLMDLGDFDGASLYFAQVLAYDKYNVAARKGLERVDMEMSRYANAAYDEARATLLAEVDAEWELPVPDLSLPAGGTEIYRSSAAADPRAYVRNKLETIVVPSVSFRETPLDDVIEFIRQRSVELDVGEADEARKGIGIILNDGGDPTLGRTKKVTLQLNNAPLSALLRYVAELTGLRYDIEQFAVVLAPVGAAKSAGQMLKVFRVPPNFLSSAPSAGASAVDDPFAPVDAGGGSELAPKLTAREYLASRGVPFGPDDSAQFLPESSSLIVRASPEAMEMVQAIVDGSITDVPKQVEIAVRILDIKQTNLVEMGFDWLLGAFNVGNERVFGAGGTPGTTGQGITDAANWPFVPPNSGVPVGQNPVTGGLRSGDLTEVDSIEGVLDRGLPQPSGDLRAPGVFSLAGVFTDPQFQVVLRAIGQHKGVDVVNVPKTVARSNQIASIRSVREFIYPTEYDPPEIPEAVGVLEADGDADADADIFVPTDQFPVTPANPTAFETRELGTILEVEPVIGPDNKFVDLSLSPEVSEFIGFINYGTPIINPFFGGVVTENQILMPVFQSLRETTSVTVLDGQTVVIGGLLEEMREDIEDSVPILGNLPVVGRLFQSSSERRTKRAIILFVTVRIIDPSGAPVNKFVTN